MSKKSGTAPAKTRPKVLRVRDLMHQSVKPTGLSEEVLNQPVKQWLRLNEKLSSSFVEDPARFAKLLEKLNVNCFPNFGTPFV